MNTRRNFIKSAALLAAGAPFIAGAVTPAAEIERARITGTGVIVEDETGWAMFEWNGDVDLALEFGNTGPLPLWGDDWKINPENQTIEFFSIIGRFCPSIEIAHLGDTIMRAPNGVFFKIPKKVLKWRFTA